jgi:tRNA(Ile)-lysidine synthase
LPALTRHFAQAEQALCDVAQHAASADAFIRESAEHLLQPMLTSGGLDAVAWRQYSPTQRFWVLRHWLAQVVNGGVSGTLLERVTQEGARLQRARWPLVGGLELRLYRGQLSVEARLVPTLPETTALGDPVMWPREAVAGEQHLPAWRGTLRWSVAVEQGVRPALLCGATLAARAGREQFQMGPGRPARPLKKQFQALGVPQWARSGPLVWQGDQLVFVPALGIDARCRAAMGEPQLVLHWHPDAADVPPTA